MSLKIEANINRASRRYFWVYLGDEIARIVDDRGLINMPGLKIYREALNISDAHWIICFRWENTTLIEIVTRSRGAHSYFVIPA